MTIYDFPDEYSKWIETKLKDLGYSLNSPKDLAKAIIKRSENYQNSDSVTDWSNPAAKAAYLAYFLPLNYIRTLKVIDEAKKFNFFSEPTSLIDFGCGPGTSTKALLNDPDISIESSLGIDCRSDISTYFLDTIPTKAHLNFDTKNPILVKPNTTLVASYVFNELSEIPSWIYKVNKIIIMEPSTKQASFEFQKTRTHLIENGYKILAPCPHQTVCPLSQSKKDWCHDRVHWRQPEWFEKVEKLLPIKNKTLTFSYLIAQRGSIELEKYTRIVGDALVEKGKTKWMICQNDQREFMSFLKRQGRPPLIYRGDKIQLNSEDKKGDEIRFDLDQISLES